MGSSWSSSSSSSSPSSAAEVAMWNVDIIQEILSRLPAVSVIRLKSVCKQWRDITSTPSFISDHSRRNPNPTPGLFLTLWPLETRNANVLYDSCSLDGRPRRVFPRTSFGPENYHMHGCCNGLMLGTFRYSRRTILVYNPTTTQGRILPVDQHCYRLDEEYYRLGVFLAFDPCRSTNYRVFSLYCPSSFSGLKITVYHSETRSWKETIFVGDQKAMSLLSCFLQSRCIRYDAPSCFLNGVIYWFETNEGSLISLDIEQRSIQMATARPPMHEDYGFLQFGPSRDRLRLVRIHRRELEVQVLELAADRSSWLVLHSVRIEDIHQLIRELVRGPICSSIYDVAYGRWVLVDDELVLRVGRTILAYHLTSKTVRVLCKDFVWGTWRICTNTLVAP